MTRKTQTLKKVKSQKNKSKSQLRKTRKVRKNKVGGGPPRFTIPLNPLKPYKPRGWDPKSLAELYKQHRI
jgi:hypothetical protein